MAVLSGLARRVLRGVIFLLCVCCVFVAMFYSYGQMKEYDELLKIEADINRRIEEEVSAQNQLELELEYNMTDVYIEKIARERLGLVKSTDIKFVDENRQ